jgi:hypothetical protein
MLLKYEPASLVIDIIRIQIFKWDPLLRVTACG